MPREIIVSPRGEAVWAKVLGEPVAYEDNPKAWSVSLLLDPSDPETIAFVERIESVFEEFHGPKSKVASNGWPFGDETMKDEKGRPVPTGKVKFNFKRKQETARGGVKDGPLVVDSKKNLWPTDMLIGNGSSIKVAFSPWKWEGPSGKGMSLELESVQVLDLVSFTKGDVADAFGEEDGYVVETPAAQAPFEAEAPAASCAPPSFADQLKKRAAEVKAEAAAVLADEIPF
jgi:hypothetical protein